ncbi:MAG: preprotein translocase subunit YajC [Propionibacteriaceae bacterium]
MEYILMVAVLMAIFWFMVVRPQQKRMREHLEQQQALAEGDRVVLTTGIFGTIRHIGDKQAVVEVAPGVDITVLRGALARGVTADEEEFEYDDDAAAAVVVDEAKNNLVPEIIKVTDLENEEI